MSKALQGILILLSAVASGWLQIALCADSDEDGLNDEIEQYLIEKYRPYYFFDHAEDKWPSSVTWYITRSKCSYRAVDSLTDPLHWVYHDTVLYTPDQIAINPELVLNASLRDHFSGDSVYADDARLPNGTGFFIDPYSGVDADGEGPCVDVGCYAHVMPIDLPLNPLPEHYPNLNFVGKAILLQFCQFFPYNDSQAAFGGDHEGDWTFLEVYIRANDYSREIGVVHHHHGDGNCTPTLQTDIRVPQGAFDVNCGDPSSLAAPQCFLEEGNHEWWPWNGDNECELFPGVRNDRHDGYGVRYRVSNVTNLGERFAPSDNLDAQLALRFNGKWGNDFDGDILSGEAPVAITHHSFFRIPKLRVAYVSPGAPLWIQLGHGSRFHPFSTIGEALESLPEGGTLKLDGGDYDGPLLIGTPGVAIRLEARNGTVVIGQ